MTTYKETPIDAIESSEPVQTEQNMTPANNLPAPIADNNPDRPTPFCTFVPETYEQKAALYRAMTNSTKKLSDLINQPIQVSDAYIEWVDVTHDDSGEIEMVPRVVLFGVNGESYTATSKGVYNSLYRLLMIFGAGHWDPPLNIVVKQIQQGDKRYYTLDLV